MKIYNLKDYRKAGEDRFLVVDIQPEAYRTVKMFLSFFRDYSAKKYFPKIKKWLFKGAHSLIFYEDSSLCIVFINSEKGYKLFIHKPFHDKYYADNPKWFKEITNWNEYELVVVDEFKEVQFPLPKTIKERMELSKILTDDYESRLKDL